MKLFNAIAAAAVIGASLIAVPTPAEAVGYQPIVNETYSKLNWEPQINWFEDNLYQAYVNNEFHLASSNQGCPHGTRYHKIRVGGLIKRTAAEGCFTDFQASQLRMQANANQQQRIRNFQQNLNESFRSPVNCSGTVNSWGNGVGTYTSSCY